MVGSKWSGTSSYRLLEIYDAETSISATGPVSTVSRAFVSQSGFRIIEKTEQAHCVYIQSKYGRSNVA
ncbi:unnamed protein product [Amoebophrya sp. A25]|nr:unnamed protein product [Amoebophrya sp. A25]|eukprot:GSA25T00013134001.1